MALGDITAFSELDSRIATAGQPNERQMGLIEAAGFQVVINLGLLDPRYCLRDERACLRELGIEYHHIPVDFEKPALSDYDHFEAAMRLYWDKKVFVHCAMNYRASCFTALFAERHLGWSRERADAWIARQWEPDAVWAELLRGVRGRVTSRAP